MTSDSFPKPAILFVCLGNICRSPLAEGAFRAAVARAGLDVHIDSAGTADWHSGKAPDPRAIRTAARHGVDIAGLRARQIAADDFHRFTHILALDHDNLAGLRQIMPAGASTAPGLFLDLVEGRAGQPVADPYYGGEEGFEQTWADVVAGADALVRLLGR